MSRCYRNGSGRIDKRDYKALAIETATNRNQLTFLLALVLAVSAIKSSAVIGL